VHCTLTKLNGIARIKTLPLTTFSTKSFFITYSVYPHA